MIELEGVSKSFADGHVALRDVSLRVAAGTTMALLGESGCGKTTTLRLVNRLVAPSAGAVRIDGRDVARVDAVELRRRIGYVVQEAGLFPHFTASENAEVVPHLLGWDAARRKARVAELFALVGLDIALHGPRYPAELSGGQRQRVGLARALAADPPIILMDEPFGALDPITRRRLQREFAGLKSRLAKTVLLVTHDVEEAFLLADVVAIMSAGRVVQVGTPDEIRTNPATDLVADFLGTANG